MKYLPVINLTLILLTVFGYFGIFIGVMLHLLTGAFQVITFIVIALQYKRWNTKVKSHLLAYGIITSIVLGLFFIDNNYFFATMVIGSIPLAIYFTYITTLLKSNRDENYK